MAHRGNTTMTESGTATAERGRKLVKSGGAQNFGHEYNYKDINANRHLTVGTEIQILKLE